MQSKTTKLWKTAEQIGLKINGKKTKVMAKNPVLTINETETVEEVDDFTYLGSIMGNDNGTSKEINRRYRKQEPLSVKQETFHKKQ